MGFLSFLFKSKKQPLISYEKTIDACWDVFRKGYQHPNPLVRRYAEEGVLNIDTPDGKRFFSVGMQDPDNENKLFCLKNIYARGGWRLAENILKSVYSNEYELELEKRLDLIYFFGDFADTNASDFMIQGLEDENIEIRIASIFSICGTRSAEKMKLIQDYLAKSNDDMEIFACLLALIQFNNFDQKSRLDEVIEKNKNNVQYMSKLKYLEFGRAKQYIEKLMEETTAEIKKLFISMINDNRGIEILKNFLNDKDPEIVKTAIEKIVEIGSRSAIDSIKAIKTDKHGVEETQKLALAIFGDKELIKEFENIAINSNFDNKNIELMRKISLFPDQNVSEIINKHLDEHKDLKILREIDLEKVNKLIEILIKYGKISSISILENYIDSSYLENEDLAKWKIVCEASAAILCILERNTTYSIAKMKVDAQGIQG